MYLRACVRKHLGQNEMPLQRGRIGDRSGRAGAKILSENLEEHSAQLEDNAIERLDLHDIGAY